MVASKADFVLYRSCTVWAIADPQADTNISRCELAPITMAHGLSNTGYLVVFLAALVALIKAKFPPPCIKLSFRASVAVTSAPRTLQGVLGIECTL